MDVRAMVEHEINANLRSLASERELVIEGLKAGRTAEYAGVERLQRKEKLADLWLNVDKMIKRADKADAVYTIRQVLEMCLDKVDDTLTTYTVRQSTSLFHVWQDTVFQAARVEFRQELAGLVRLAETEERSQAS